MSHILGDGDGEGMVFHVGGTEDPKAQRQKRTRFYEAQEVVLCGHVFIHLLIPRHLSRA